MFYVYLPYLWLMWVLVIIMIGLRNPEADSWGPLSGNFEDHTEGSRVITWVFISLQ